MSESKSLRMLICPACGRAILNHYYQIRHKKELKDCSIVESDSKPIKRFKTYKNPDSIISYMDYITKGYDMNRKYIAVEGESGRAGLGLMRKITPEEWPHGFELIKYTIVRTLVWWEQMGWIKMEDINSMVKDFKNINPPIGDLSYLLNYSGKSTSYPTMPYEPTEKENKIEEHKISAENKKRNYFTYKDRILDLEDRAKQNSSLSYDISVPTKATSINKAIAKGEGLPEKIQIGKYTVLYRYIILTPIDKNIPDIFIKADNNNIKEIIKIMKEYSGNNLEFEHSVLLRYYDSGKLIDALNDGREIFLKMSKDIIEGESKNIKDVMEGHIFIKYTQLQPIAINTKIEKNIISALKNKPKAISSKELYYEIDFKTNIEPVIDRSHIIPLNYKIPTMYIEKSLGVYTTVVSPMIQLLQVVKIYITEVLGLPEYETTIYTGLEHNIPYSKDNLISLIQYDNGKIVKYFQSWATILYKFFSESKTNSTTNMEQAIKKAQQAAVKKYLKEKNATQEHVETIVNAVEKRITKSFNLQHKQYTDLLNTISIYLPVNSVNDERFKGIMVPKNPS